MADVRFSETTENDYLENNSLTWQDEYTLRLSGFSEAKSKMAMELERKKKDLAKAKEQLEIKIKNFASERRILTKERENLAKEMARIADMEKEYMKMVENQNKATSDGQQSLSKNTKMTSEKANEKPTEKSTEKPGDKKEGDKNAL
ncbi:MAG: hypothetical protein HQK54_11105 [Oligoflexales bacterium]|nr:hypothetical protein [Oligoflexales bacterium]